MVVNLSTKSIYIINRPNETLIILCEGMVPFSLPLINIIECTVLKIDIHRDILDRWGFESKIKVL